MKRFYPSKKTNSAPIRTNGGSSTEAPATFTTPAASDPLFTQPNPQPPPEVDYNNEEGEGTEDPVQAAHPTQPTMRKRAWLVEVIGKDITK